jgi:hypothetical protein
MRTEAATPIPHSLNLVVVGPSTEEGVAGIGGTVCSYAGAARLERCGHILRPPNFLDAERVRRLAVGSGTAACASARRLCIFQRRWRVNSDGWYLDSDIGGASVEQIPSCSCDRFRWKLQITREGGRPLPGLHRSHDGMLL